MVAIATPMHEGGEVDYDALAKYVEFHIENDTDVLVPAGTTGESATLDHAEHCEVIRFVVEQVKGRIPVIAGTGANSTSEALELTQNAKQAGADACLLVTPYYNKPTQEGLYQHYKKIAESVDIPMILYNVPGRTAVDMTAATTARLAKIDNIIGTKEAHGTVERIKEVLSLCPDDFIVMTGDDGTAMESILAGARGNISVTANVAPAIMHQMCAAALAKDESKARELDAQVADLHNLLFVESSPIPAKWALQQMGLIGGGIRLPMTPLDSGCHSDVAGALKKAGVLA